MKKLKNFILVLSIFSIFPLFSEETDEKYTRLNELLAGYLQNDLQLQRYVITAESKALSLDSTKISNGISINLNTGDMTITTDTGNNRKFTISPSISVKAPQLHDLSLNATMPITITPDDKTLTNGSISATVGIISGVKKQARVNVLEAERAFLEAQRNVQDRALSAEKDFYSKLKNLYSYALDVIKAKADLFDDSLDLRVLTAQGYSKTSASYRQKNLKVISDKRNIQEKQRLLERETQIFAKKCGFDFSRTTTTEDTNAENGKTNERFDPIKAGEQAYEASVAFLPTEIPSGRKNEVNIFKFAKENYSQIEEANWKKYIGELKREANYKMTLKATAEYKLNSNQSKYDDIGGKVSWAWKGLSASGGMYFPLGTSLFDNAATTVVTKKNDSPYFQLSFGVSLNDWKLAEITEKQEELDAQLEDNAILSANDSYETDVMSKVSTFHDLKWNQRSYAEEYQTYVQLAADMEKWYEQGIVTENDYLDAQNNKEKARINILINNIQLLIYNDETKLLFHEDKNETDKEK